MSASITSGPALDSTLGAMEIGTAVATFLSGILTLQTLNYYGEFPKDSILLRSTIAIIWLFEFGHTICSSHAIYWMTVTTYDRPPNSFIPEPPQSLIVTLFFAAGIDPVSQVFFDNQFQCNLAALTFFSVQRDVSFAIHLRHNPLVDYLGVQCWFDGSRI
ncbi:hypothetical protein DFH09DRAFT_1329747 [Mycena vulgaris]|nr:hypothetical protein DFH09DRAFT_1329747 [Mycena vulgaris]